MPTTANDLIEQVRKASTRSGRRRSPAASRPAPTWWSSTSASPTRSPRGNRGGPGRPPGLPGDEGGEPGPRPGPRGGPLLRRRGPLGAGGPEPGGARLHEGELPGRRLRRLEAGGAAHPPGAWLTSAQRMRYARHLSMPEVDEPGRRSSWTPRCCASAPGAWGRRRPSTSPRRGWAPSASSTTTWSTSRTSSGRSSTTPIAWASPRSTRRSDPHRAEPRRHRAQAPDPDRLRERHGIFRDYDLIVDGSDNFPTRYLVNDASVFLGKPVVHGSIFRFEGQCTTFYPGEGPCYRCLYPEPPPAGMAPSCAEAGVLGVLPGLVGSMEALEAIKLILGIGGEPRGEALGSRHPVEQLPDPRARRNPSARQRGPHGHRAIDFEAFCAIAA